MRRPWQHGDVVVARDVMEGAPWLAFPMYVAADGDHVLVTWLPEGAPLGYLPDSDIRGPRARCGRAPGC